MSAMNLNENLLYNRASFSSYGGDKNMPEEGSSMENLSTLYMSYYEFDVGNAASPPYRGPTTPSY